VPVSGAHGAVPTRALARWTRDRPFWAGLLTAAAGLVILVLPGGRFTVLLLPGLAGTSGFLFGAGLCAMGLFFWFRPAGHRAVGVTAVLVSVASLVTTNLGGFVVGMLLGILGGSLGFAWEDPDQGAQA